MKYLIIFFIITLIYACCYKTKRALHMLQQNLYNENNRYVKWLIKNKNIFISSDILLIILSIVELIVLSKNKLINNLGIIIISIVLIFIGLKWKKIIKTNQDKKRLVITARVKRLIITTSILYLLPLLVLKNKWLFIGIELAMSYLNSIVVLIAMFINMPIEKCVYFYYKSKAQKKLKSMNKLKIIGITGSYGKTSSKNILSDILNIMLYQLQEI